MTQLGETLKNSWEIVLFHKEKIGLALLSLGIIGVGCFTGHPDIGIALGVSTTYIGTIILRGKQRREADKEFLDGLIDPLGHLQDEI